MHPFAFIPYLAVLLAAAFVAVSAVWDANRSTRGSMTEIFACLLGWAFVDLFGHLETDPERALFWVKLVHLPALLLTVCVVRLVSQMVPQSAARLDPLARIGFVAAVGFGLAATVVPGVAHGVTPTAWGGWIPQFGVASLAVIPIGTVLPMFAAYEIRRVAHEPGRGGASSVDRLQSRSVGVGVAISIAAALSTELVFPYLAIPVPRLGALATVVASATVWVHLLHRSDDLGIAPQATARAVLAKLHDGVALVERGGTICTSNPRLAELVGTTPESLVGRPLSDIVDLPLEILRDGLEEREIRLDSTAGVRVPVSLSSSCVRDRRGDTHWFVVVFRDLRSVDALRRRLMTSGRLAAVGELAAGIAHEVNNPVTFIRSDLNFLRSRLTEIEAQFAKSDPYRQEASLFAGGESSIDAALDGIARVAEVVSDVREFAHVGAEGFAPGDPRAIVASAVRLARLERREAVELEIGQLGSFARVVAGQDFKQVILALLRVMTVNSESGACVRVEAKEDASLLRVVLWTNRVDASSSDQVERFRRAGENMLDASADDLGLAIAIELADQLGGSVTIEAPTPRSLRLRLAWPLDREEVDA
jgi:PAS domain S-box-containing protein